MLIEWTAMSGAVLSVIGGGFRRALELHFGSCTGASLCFLGFPAPLVPRQWHSAQSEIFRPNLRASHATLSYAMILCSKGRATLRYADSMKLPAGDETYGKKSALHYATL